MVTRLMESSPSSRLSFFIESGAIIPCPIEGRICGIAINIPKELWPAISLKLGTTSLPLRLDEAANTAQAPWPPCGPGQYDLFLECGDIRERRTVTVAPQHFTEIDFNSMLRELTELLPKSIAAQLQTCGGLLDINLALDHEPTIEREFCKLHRAITGTKERLGLLQILPMIQRECHQVLVPRFEIRDTNKLRRPDISKLPRAISMPGNIAASRALKRMFDVTVERSFETYENRLVKAYVQSLQSQMSRLQARLKSEPAPPAMASDLEALLNEVRLACARATFLREVRLPLVSTVRVTMVLLKNPAYRAVLEDYVALHKQSPVRLEEPALTAPLNNFPFLYQLWANLRVVNAMLQACAESGYRCISHPWVKKDNLGLFIEVINDGEPAIQLSNPTTGKVVSLLAWRPASGSKNTKATNQELPPALAIAIYAPEKPPVVLLFDPRYKVAAESAKKSGKKTKTKLAAAKSGVVETPSTIEPMKEDIDELLRGIKQATSPQGVREIQYAAILYPGQRKQIAPDLEALPARPSDGQALQKSVYDVLRRYLA